jgi:hypothetical protein
MAKTSGGFRLTGKGKPAQFGKTGAGSSEKSFKQWSPKAVTAAMQGRPPQGGKTTAKPKNNGSRQFSKTGGKAVF